MKILFPLLLVLFFNGCVKEQNTTLKTVQKTNQEPIWLQDPQKEANGKITAVGCASRHIKGIVGQKKLAVQRAIDEIAMQKQTTVQNSTYRTKNVHDGKLNSSAQSESLQQVHGVNIQTKIMEYYTKKDGDICVWVVEN